VWIAEFAQTQVGIDGERGAQPIYYAFDLLPIDGWDVSDLQVIERKALLEHLIAGRTRS
jgi:ATP-dependent DNA ligase